MKRISPGITPRFIFCGAALVFGVAAFSQPEFSPAGNWWGPGVDRVIEGEVEFDNPHGRLRLINSGPPIRTAGHPFFEPIGENGRACVTCHQPADAMGLSVDMIRAQWEATGGKDPLFAAVDGSNCPNLPQDDPGSHSLLLEKGLFRIARPWPPRADDGTAIEPEFTLEVIEDPTGCNLDPEYGLHSDEPMVSVYRRPRPVANMKYLLTLPNGVTPHEYFMYNDKSLLPKDPETGEFVSVQLMSDGRLPTLSLQARDAGMTHLEMLSELSESDLEAIESFERSIYVAQSYSRDGGDLTGPSTPPGLGPEAMRDGYPGELGNNPINRVFGTFEMWDASSEEELLTERDRFRASVARGAKVFMDRRFIIKDVGVYNDKGLGNPFKRSCASGCHNTLLAGMDLAPGFMDLGLNNWPWNRREDLPLFKAVCRDDARPQSYLGRVVYTHDPGRALVTGKCSDLGASMTQQMRGLAARAPYFMNGSADTLRELVDFYDRRFNIRYTEQEKRDLVNFMSVL
ncbi:hypothetical protein FHS61_002508 [Altererythrobacter atlanticus]|uniref:Uncharacterized protein n=1 Tax=Croceibacterium atlanticum TaxID=1267766 RepID=A0A0F7KQW5_9SPHN|nr:hypothetical protein [Croceibacterium atlanticum]AKH41959.1 hypothetical protein WYH_00911 [Croceibacterium atlanticum]MBB5733473.1 hypothetical protein [Croceibacterium atlanticum]